MDDAEENSPGMILELKRRWFSDKSTIGDLFLDGAWECFTLEDKVREGPKVPGQTAIPAGSYDVVVDFSQRFARRMPHVLNVPDFVGIRIHPGNTDKDTEGCILVGSQKEFDRVLHSVGAFGTLFAKIDAALDDGHSVRLIITGEPPVPAPSAVTLD